MLLHAVNDTLIMGLQTPRPGVLDFLLNNWGELLIAALAFAKVVVNLTPSEKDNQVFGYIDNIITAITGDRRTDSKE